MATVSLQADPRPTAGKGAARKLRRSGQIPAIVYSGGKPATAIALDPTELELAFARTMNPNTLVDIDVAGEKLLCLVRATQRHPVSKDLRHIDFFQVDEKEPVTVQVPVTTSGKAAGEQIGGQVRRIRRVLAVRCKPADIPDAIDVDVRKMTLGDMIKVSQVVPPANCELVYATDFNVVSVSGRRTAVGDVEAEGEEGAEA